MASESCLKGVAVNLENVVVDGERAEALKPSRKPKNPGFLTSEEIAKEAGINRYIIILI